jgi:hypothetical protein
MALLDDTGGKPPTGYGSGPNSGSPVATPEQTAAILIAEATALQADGASMCLSRAGGYDLGGAFCQGLAHEIQALRTQGVLLTHQPSFNNVAKHSRSIVLKGVSGLRKAADVSGRMAVGLTTTKGKFYAAGVVVFSASAATFGGLVVIAARGCWAAAKLEKGLTGAELAASTCPFVVGTLAEGAMLSAAFAGLSGYALYQEGSRKLDRGKRG